MLRPPAGGVRARRGRVAVGREQEEVPRRAARRPEHARLRASAPDGDALCVQIGGCITSNCRTRRQEKLADRIAEISGWTKCFFCNSAPRRTRPRSRSRACMATSRASPRRPIVVMEKPSTAARSRRCQPPAARKAQAGFEPLLAGFVRVRSTTSKRCARWPRTTERGRGVRRADPGRRRHQRLAPRVPARAQGDLRAQPMAVHVSTRCSGLGRTGKWFVVRSRGVLPDVVPLAKGLGFGRAGRRVRGRRPAARRSSSPAATARPSAATRSHDLRGRHPRHHQGRRACWQALARGGRDPWRLSQIAGNFPELRGMGLMIGMELASRGELVKAGAGRRPGDQRHRRQRGALLPPLVMTEARGPHGGRAPRAAGRDFLARSGRPREPFSRASRP